LVAFSLAKYLMVKVLQGRQYAAYHFGGQSPGQLMTAIPRYKFMFYAEFVVNSHAATLYPWLRQLGTNQGVSFKIKTIDKPNVELMQRELNQYNHKRFAYVKTEYKPINITLYDTVDNKPLDLWRQYFTYYFGDARQKFDTTMGSNPTDQQFQDGTGWGLRPLAENIYFFNSIDLYGIHGKKYTRVSYLNPKITSVNWQNYDTTDSSMEEVTMSFSYETLRYDPSTDIDADTADKFGFNVPPGFVESQVNAGANIPSNSITDSVSADKNYELNQPAGSPSSVGAGSSTDFGVANSSYNTITNSNAQPKSGMGKSLGAVTYASAVSAYDNLNASGNPGATAMSNQPTSPNLGVSGLPNGQLPTQTGQIQTNDSNLKPIGMNPNSPLGGGSYEYTFGA
jgi:hypothetical protein